MSGTTERKKFRYFFINGKLHKILLVTWGRDEVLTWCYEEHARRIYPWSMVRKKGQRGFTIGQVSKIVNRTPRMIKYYIADGLIEKPQKTYSLSTGQRGMGIFSEDDVYKIREITSGQHIGRPRKDGFVRPLRLATKEEVYAKVKHDMTLYARTEDGRYIPLYEAEEW